MVQVALVCLDVQGGSVNVVDIDTEKFVWHLQQAVAEILKYDSKANELKLFPAKTADGAWLPLNDPDVAAMRSGTISEKVQNLLNSEIDPAEEIGDVFVPTPRKKQIHVLVLVPCAATGSALSQSANKAALQKIAWYGTRGPIVRGEGIDLNDPRTLSRITLTADIIRRLEETHVLLVKSPLMTGKTSLATLVSRSLVDRHTMENKKMALFNFSALGIPDELTFEQAFKKRCTIDWSEATLYLPAPDRIVYLVVDEVQAIYQEGANPPKCKSSGFWELVKYVLSNGNYSIRILLFAAYGCGVEYTRLASPIQFDDSIVLDICQLNFSHAEVSEYVRKWFKGITCFEGSSSSAMEEFCVNLEEVTGGHVGLCAAAIQELNKVHVSRNRSASHQPLPAEWIRMLQSGSLYRANDRALFEALTSTRAVKVLNKLDKDELDQLERIAYNAESRFGTDIVDQCLRKGILAQKERRLEFSSPVMWRYFVKMRVGHIIRALHVPQTLPEMIARVMRSIDYESIRQTLGRSLSNDIPLERAWQMEFYKAVYRCTPSTFLTSADVGALFGSSGFVDFTIHNDDIFWGIKLLQETSNMAEHIKRFSLGGRYSLLPLSDFCLIDFRRVATIDDVPKERITADMRNCDKLFVMCYDTQLAGVAVFNSAMDIVYRSQS